MREQPPSPHVLSAVTPALARRGIAIRDRVPRAGVVRNDVVSLLAPSRATGSATVRNPASSSDMPKSPTFARRKSPRGWFERRLAVGSRLACLGATTCALQRPSGANSAPPPRCLVGCTEVRRGASRDGMVVSTEVRKVKWLRMAGCISGCIMRRTFYVGSTRRGRRRRGRPATLSFVPNFWAFLCAHLLSLASF